MPIRPPNVEVILRLEGRFDVYAQKRKIIEYAHYCVAQLDGHALRLHRAVNRRPAVAVFRESLGDLRVYKRRDLGELDGLVVPPVSDGVCMDVRRKFVELPFRFLRLRLGLIYTPSAR